MIRTETHEEFRLATLEMEAGHYLDLTSLLSLIEDPNHGRLWNLLHDNGIRIESAKGSSNNHQAWVGGYLDHVVETMNIACQQYLWMSKARRLPFELSEALEVMFLHDLEKPWKHTNLCWCGHFKEQHLEDGCAVCADEQCAELKDHEFKQIQIKTKQERREFREKLIRQYMINLSEEQENALKYVEGVPDSEYTPGERTMGELAAFCHCCDILSARMWHDKGQGIPAPAWE